MDIDKQIEDLRADLSGIAKILYQKFTAVNQRIAMLEAKIADLEGSSVLESPGNDGVSV